MDQARARSEAGAGPAGGGQRSARSGGAIGVVAALPQELGALPRRPWRSVHGLELLELDLPGPDGAGVLAVVCGIGKVRAARAAAVLLHAGADQALLSVGVCGALRRRERVGDLLVCERAVQADLAVRADRERTADPDLGRLWAEVGGARPATFLTADRPVLSPWRRLRLARAFLGPCAAEMETAALAWVAHSAGVPWGALRAVSDDVGLGRRHGFVHNFPAQAGRAAATLPALFGALGAAPGAGGVEPSTDPVRPPGAATGPAGSVAGARPAPGAAAGPQSGADGGR